MIDRKAYFDSVRASLFAGNMSQQQVDGQNDILDVWDSLPRRYPDVKLELRWLSYMLATTYHETGQKMWPVKESGEGAGQPYGVPDLATGQTYYGRGYVQLTWRDNYQHATEELELTGNDDLVQHADRALDPVIAARIMYLGMYQGWFRSDSNGAQTLPRYFSSAVDDAYGAREIINGDKSLTPSWSMGESVGNLIKGYHEHFLKALTPPSIVTPTVAITVTGNVRITINGNEVA